MTLKSWVPGNAGSLGEGAPAFLTDPLKENTQKQAEMVLHFETQWPTNWDLPPNGMMCRNFPQRKNGTSGKVLQGHFWLSLVLSYCTVSPASLRCLTHSQLTVDAGLLWSTISVLPRLDLENTPEPCATACSASCQPWNSSRASPACPRPPSVFLGCCACQQLPLPH